MSEREEQVNPVEGTASSRAEPWLPESNPVESFTSTIEHALRQLSIELAAIRAERDGLRLELEGLRAQHDLLRQQLQDRGRFDATVRELGEIIRTLNVPLNWVEPAPQPQPQVPLWNPPPVPPVAYQPPPAPYVPPAAFPAPPAYVAPAPAPPPAAPAPPAAPVPPAPTPPADLAPAEPDPFAWADPAPAPGDVDWSSYLGPTAAPAPEAPPAEAPAAVEVPVEPVPVTSTPEPPAGPPTEEVPAAVWVSAPAPEAPAEPQPAPAPQPEPEPTPEPVQAEAPPAPAPTPGPSFRDAPPAAAHDPFGLQVIDENVWQVPSGDGRRGSKERQPGDRLRTIGRRLGIAVIGFVIFAMALVAIGPKVLPYQTFFVRSGSMEPTIGIGELIFLSRVDASDLDEGDIITFERPDRPGTMVTHRITAIETTDQGKVFQTKGDANGSPDVWRVPASGEGWKYSFGIPKVGYVFGYLNTPQARLALLAIPAVILGLLSLIDIWKPKAKPAARARR